MSIEETAPTADTTPVKTETETKEEPTVQSEVELAQRAFALKNYEEAVDHYATALELARVQFGENSSEFADLLLVYGRALIENAIVQNSVLGKDTDGKEGAQKDADPAGSSGSKPNPNDGRIHFGADASSDDEGGDTTVDLSGDATIEDKDEPEEQEKEGADEDEPEDDFNAAWDVLDLARAYYDKQPGDDMKLKLAEAYMSLGDVSLETEKFEQAISDYTSGLAIKTQLLPFYSRQVCEAHYRLALVLDLTPGKMSDGIRHIEQAIASLKARATVIQERLETPLDVKGKGKGVAVNDSIDTMDEAGLRNELKDVEELLNDLSLKHEDMKVAPEAQNPVAGVASEAEQTKKALDEWLKPSLPAPEVPPAMDGPVNDLSKLVKKKKKPAAADANGSTPTPTATLSAAPAESTGTAPSTTGGKRKVEIEETEDEPSPKEKKAKLAAE